MTEVGTLLVTGAPGWFTSRFLQSILEQPLPGQGRVSCLVDSRLPETDKELQSSLGPGVVIVRGNLTDPASLRQATLGVQTIVHAAGVIHVRKIHDYFDVNTQGTFNLADAAVANGARRIVYLSTNAAGGRSAAADNVLKESDPSRPLSPYARSKWLAEEALRALAGKIESVSLRPSMFYGAPVPARHIDIYRKIQSGRMPLVGGGEFARSVTHVDNLVQAARLACMRPEAVGQTYYIADETPYTTRRIVDAMAAALGVAPRYMHLPSFAATWAYDLDAVLSWMDFYVQPLHLLGEANWHVGLSIEKARAELGYSPTVALEEGMKGAVDWCRAKGLLH
jgi:nucleoside-diphosphate-sugar epimerase